MNSFKKLSQGLLIAVTVLLSTISSAVVAEEVDKTKPYEMITIVSERLFERLKSEREAIRENPELLKTVVEEELMPYVDHRYASLKVVGSYLKQEKNRDNVYEFIDAFRLYLISSYAQVLTLYTDQTIEFEPQQALDESKRIISVKVNVIDTPRPDIKLEFKLRKNKKTGEWLAFDMVAEGISLLSSKQSEWNPKIRKEGIPAVSTQLNEISIRPVRFEGEKS